MERRFGDPLAVRLCWRPQPGRELVLERAYGANGMPQPEPLLI